MDGEEGGEGVSLSYIRPKIGEFGRQSPEIAPGARKPNGRLWGRISDQVSRNSLERTPWGKFLNVRKFPQFKNNSSKGKLATSAEWALRIVNEFDHFTADPDSIKTR